MQREADTQKNVLAEVAQVLPEIIELRRDIHAHPEMGLEEVRTAAIAAAKLREYGCDEVHEGIGKTGVIGLIRGRLGASNRCVAIRADMDALPLEEKTGLPWASQIPGRMHACGHDGHVACALAAAAALCRRRDFAGTAMIIIQPGEEGWAGARCMIEDGLFTRFPADEVYAGHGTTDIGLGEFAAGRGAVMAAADLFHITVRGVGGHGARPHLCVDPVVAACELVTGLQTIASRSSHPMHPVVVSVGSIHGGSDKGVSVIPDSVRISGTTRCMRACDRDLIERRMGEICAGISAQHGVNAELQYVRMYPATVNHDAQHAALGRVMCEIAGQDAVNLDYPSSMGAEDFSFMLEKVPGVFFRIGMKDADHKAFAHHPQFDFNDKCIGQTASIMTRIVEARLAALNEADQ